MPGGDTYVVRPARGEDVEALAGMRLRLQAHLEAGTPTLARFSEARLATLPDFYRECLAEGRYIVVAMHEGSDAPVGMIMGRVDEMPSLAPSLYGYVDDVWIDVEHRRRGLCKSMMRAMVAYFRERGVERLVLNYATGNVEARETWTRLGFEPFRITAQAPLQTVWDSVNEEENAR